MLGESEQLIKTYQKNETVATNHLKIKGYFIVNLGLNEY